MALLLNSLLLAAFLDCFDSLRIVGGESLPASIGFEAIGLRVGSLLLRTPFSHVSFTTGCDLSGLLLELLTGEVEVPNG